MVLICAADEKRAKEIGAAVKGPRVYTLTSSELAERTGALGPSVLLLDVRVGGSRVRAVELVPWILKASPLTAIVVLTYSPTAEEIEEIRALGAYSFVDLDSVDVPGQLKQAFSSAREDRPRRRLSVLLRRARSLH